jgi:hypothetical protein
MLSSAGDGYSGAFDIRPRAWHAAVLRLVNRSVRRWRVAHLINCSISTPAADPCWLTRLSSALMAGTDAVSAHGRARSWVAFIFHALRSVRQQPGPAGASASGIHLGVSWASPAGSLALIRRIGNLKLLNTTCSARKARSTR